MASLAALFDQLRHPATGTLRDIADAAASPFCPYLADGALDFVRDHGRADHTAAEPWLLAEITRADQARAHASEQGVHE
jgi:hypothetical protein